MNDYRAFRANRAVILQCMESYESSASHSVSALQDQVQYVFLCSTVVSYLVAGERIDLLYAPVVHGGTGGDNPESQKNTP
jgi:hypothetical protein